MLETQTLPPLSGDKADSLVILLHGLGADGADLIDLGRAWGPLLPRTAFAAPNAPFPCDMGPFGYQWFSLQDFSMPSIAKGIREAAPLLNAYLDEMLATYALSPRRLALVGFSQGTMMSLHVAPRRAESFAGVLGYSGLLSDPDALKTEKKSEPPIFLIHGTHDPVVPFRALEESTTGLRMAGFPVKSLACPGLAHGIDDVGLREGGLFLRGLLG